MVRTILTAAVSVLCLGGVACSKSPMAPKAPGDGLVQTLSGMVFESMPEGQRPVPSGRLVVVSGAESKSALIDDLGRYSVTVDADWTAIFAAIDSVRIDRHQPCAAGAVLQGDTVLDVEYNLRQVPGTGGPPYLSGTVKYVNLRNSPVPLQATRVNYFSGNILVAYTFTDEAGSYTLCRLPAGPGKLVVAPGLDDFGLPYYIERPVDIAGDAVLDVELTFP